MPKLITSARQQGHHFVSPDDRVTACSQEHVGHREQHHEGEGDAGDKFKRPLMNRQILNRPSFLLPASKDKLRRRTTFQHLLPRKGRHAKISLSQRCRYPSLGCRPLPPLCILWRLSSFFYSVVAVQAFIQRLTSCLDTASNTSSTSNPATTRTSSRKGYWEHMWPFEDNRPPLTNTCSTSPAGTCCPASGKGSLLTTVWESHLRTSAVAL